MLRPTSLNQKDSGLSRILPIIKKSRLFYNIDENLEAILSSCLSANVKTYGADQYIIRQGDPNADICIVLSGSVQLIKETDDGSRYILSEFHVGDLFGEVVSYGGFSASTSAFFTTTGCDILHFDAALIAKPCDLNCTFHSQMMKNMLNILAQKVDSLEKRFDIFTQKSIKQKLIAFLRTEMQAAGKKSFRLKFTREEMAEYLFVNRSALSRTLCEMRDEGMIEFKGNHFTIHFE